jgi:enterochelin esterase-like enzyme
MSGSLTRPGAGFLWNILAFVRVDGLMKTFLSTLAVTLPLVTHLVSAQEPCRSTVVGDLRITQFQSKMYGETFKVRVWLPPGYRDADNAKRKYPTLYMLDGQTLFDECTAFHGEHELRVDETVTKLIDEHAIPPMIVVGVDSTHHRDYQYSPYPSPITDPDAPEPIGKKLPRFFANEVIPFVSARYRVTDDPAHTGIGGTSLGGAAALYLALNRPDLFGLALLQSPSLLLGNGQFLRDTSFLVRGPGRVAIGVGTAELNFPNIEEWLAPRRLTRAEAESGIVAMTQALASNLKGAYINHPKVLLVVEPNANHSSAFWAGRMPEAIKFLFGGSGN